MPELDAEASPLAIGAEQGGDAIATAAAVGVGVTPEGRHGAQGPAEDGPEGLGTTGMADGAGQTTGQAAAAGRIGGPAGRPVAVVLLHEDRQQVGLWAGRGVAVGGDGSGGGDLARGEGLVRRMWVPSGRPS